jgi:hypothetical protein
VLDLPNTAASASKAKSKADELFAEHDPTKPKKKAAPKTGKRRRRTSAAEEEDDDDEANNAASTSVPAEESTEQTASTQQPLVQELEGLNLATAASKAASDGSSRGLQIMDLESEEPVIMYRGQMYSCHWASSIGSDLLFMRRPDEPSADYNPLRSMRNVDLLGISAAKLVATPTTIERKPDYSNETDPDAPLADQNANIQHADVLRQATFLERLADIKTERGEMVGNLKSFAQGVQRNPENFGPGARGGRGGRARKPATPRKRPTAAENRGIAAAAVEMPTIATTRTRRASTQSAPSPKPATWDGLDEDEQMADA